MDFHRHQQSQLVGLYMAMSLEQFDSAAALSKETSDENLCGVEADAVEAQVASVLEDGLTHFICLTFDIIVWMFSYTRQFSMCPCVELGCCTHDIERALSRTAPAPLSLDGKWRIYFGKKANPMVLHLSGTCVSHRDTPVFTEDTTSLQPSHSRLQVASLRGDGRAHTMHLFVFEHIALEVFSVARPNAHLSIRNVPERHAHLSVFRHDDTSSVLKACSLTVPMFGPAPRRTQHHWNRNEVPEEWHNGILMQGDISNACGSINRLQVLQAVRMHIPGLAPLCASQLPCKNETVTARKPSSTTVVRWVSGK